MLLEDMEELIVSLGGRRHPRLPYWNPSDDSPTLDCAVFQLGAFFVEACKQRPGTSWPNYPCAGDSIRNKFAVRLVERPVDPHELVKLIMKQTSGFVDINFENVEKYIRHLV